MTKILMMTLTPQLHEIAIKKRASYPSSIREPDIVFPKNSRQNRSSRNQHETGINGKLQITICKKCSSNNFT